MCKPFLSIVTISFNQVHFLRQAVESVLSQKTTDVEYIVVDPGSTDGSREVLASYGSSIDQLILEPDMGPANGLNKGFSRARGSVGYFLNSDDFLLPGSIDRLRLLWRTHTDVDVLLAGAWMVDGDGLPLRELRATRVSLPKLLDGRAIIVQQGMSFRMDRYRAVGGFKDMNLTCWDYELLCDMVQSGARTHVSSARIGAFRMHNASLSAGIRSGAHWSRLLADQDRIYERMTGRQASTSIRIRRRVSRFAKYLSNPVLVADRFRERLTPKSIEMRWQIDHSAASKGPSMSLSKGDYGRA